MHLTRNHIVFILHQPNIIVKRELLHLLDEKAAEADISRNELINQMILFALAHMEKAKEP